MKNLLVIIAMITLTACATVEGVGQDISAASRKVSNW
jgi:predicted small secreted protein